MEPTDEVEWDIMMQMARRGKWHNEREGGEGRHDKGRNNMTEEGEEEGK